MVEDSVVEMVEDSVVETAEALVVVDLAVVQAEDSVVVDSVVVWEAEEVLFGLLQAIATHRFSYQQEGVVGLQLQTLATILNSVRAWVEMMVLLAYPLLLVF